VAEKCRSFKGYRRVTTEVCSYTGHLNGYITSAPVDEIVELFKRHPKLPEG
jgi:hypothetical protein